jgi:uncharacterized protein
MKVKIVVSQVVLLFCLSIGLPTFAQNSPVTKKEALIKELLGLMDASVDNEAMATQMLEEMRGELLEIITLGVRIKLTAERTDPLDPKKQEALIGEVSSRIVDRIYVEIKKRINFKEMSDQEGVRAYDKYFTEAELKDLIAFYRTPIGKKILSTFPQIFSEVSQSVTAAVKPKVSKLVEEVFEDEMKKTRGELIR